ncbi:MAG: DUF4160 domain-containing protein [Candidatus Kapabacteria bacterium]|nr:DUF4160 domain-containing protein [Candidatus Kapabacteria bacterium]
MPTISVFYGIVITMFWKEHGVPHFHALYGEYEASIEIESGAVYSGALPPRVAKLVREWAKIHRRELRENWDLCRKKVPPKRIQPLD